MSVLMIGGKSLELGYRKQLRSVGRCFKPQLYLRWEMVGE